MHAGRNRTTGSFDDTVVKRRLVLRWIIGINHTIFGENRHVPACRGDSELGFFNDEEQVSM